FYLADDLEYLLIPGVASEWIEVRVMLNPLSELWTGTWQRTFQQIERCIDVTQFRVAARQIVLGKGVVRLDRQGAGHPFPGTIVFAKFEECCNAQMGRPRIFRVNGKFTLGKFHPFACSVFAILITAKRPVNL